MKQKVMIIIGIVLVGILLLGILFYWIDAKRAEEGKTPIFGIPILKDQTIAGKDTPEQREGIYFIATILQIGNNTMLVEPLEGEDIRSSADKITITDKLNQQWKVGDTVKVTYMGYVMETYPAKVDTIKVENYVALKDIKENYTTEEAIKDGYLVASHQDVYNSQVAEQFQEKVANNQVAEMRIVKHTVEGDLILTQVRYQNGKFKVWNDSTRDKFSAQQDRTIIYREYEHLGTIENRVYVYDGETLNLEKDCEYLYRLKS